MQFETKLTIPIVQEEWSTIIQVEINNLLEQVKFAVRLAMIKSSGLTWLFCNFWGAHVTVDEKMVLF